MFFFIREWKRKRLRNRPFPKEWYSYLKDLPFYQRLNESQQQKLRDDLKVFAWEKCFIEAGGMEITDEVTVVISACAAQVVLCLDINFYDPLREIVVYPANYRHPDSDYAIQGEAHVWGIVVLSWSAVLAGINAPTDGKNTAVHEFAHVLDQADGAFDGTPELHASEHYRPWAVIMDHHFQRLRKGMRKERSVLDSYGATDEAEFFAVATEVFFENPKSMYKKTPDLYHELSRFYQYDPLDAFHSEE